MKLVKVIKNGQVVQPVKFDNDADMNAWIQMLADTGAWGLPERPELNEMGEPTGVVLEAEYQIDIKDITAEVQAEKQAKEAKRLAKEKRKTDRKVIDWSKNLTTKQLQEIVKNLVEDKGED